MRERIDAARKLLRRLEADRPPPKTATGSRAPGAGPAALDARLSAIRVESRAALGVALMAGSRSQEARRLRDDIQFERLRTIGALADLPPSRRSNPARAIMSNLARLRRSMGPSPLRTAAPAVLGVAGAFAVLGVAVALVAVLAGGPDAVSSGGNGANSTSTPEGAVAGNRMATPSVAPSAEHGEAGDPSPMTFDELIMGRALPRAIDRLVRSGTAEVAAIPNAVDRSLRLVTTDGSPGMVCRRLPDAAPYSVVAEVLAPAPHGQRLVLRREQLGEPTEAGIEIGDDGTLMVVPDGNVLGSISPGEWVEVELALDPSGSMLQVTTRATPGGEATTVQVAAGAGWVGAARSEFCVSSPPVTNGEVYVNDLRIH